MVRYRRLECRPLSRMLRRKSVNRAVDQGRFSDIILRCSITCGADITLLLAEDLVWSALLSSRRSKPRRKRMASENITSMAEVAASTRELEGLGQGGADMTALCRGSIGAAMASSQAAICGVQ